MKPIKLNKQQLRSLISEAIQAKMPGEAEPFAVNEVHHSSLSGGHIHALDSLIDVIKQEWLGQYDEGDPTIARLGPKAWEQQVDSACDKLASDIDEALSEVDAMLQDGQFYMGGSNL